MKQEKITIRDSKKMNFDPTKMYTRHLKRVFNLFHLSDFKESLDDWKDKALCAHPSAYYEPNLREKLVLFVKELQRLTEAFHLLLLKKTAEQASKKWENPRSKNRTTHHRPLFLTPHEFRNPFLVIHSFTQTYSKTSAEGELLDMLEAAVIYRGALPDNKECLVLLYRQLDFLIKLAFAMKKNGLKKQRKFSTKPRVSAYVGNRGKI